MILFSFKKKYSSKIVQICYAGLHFIQNKYGHYDRQKYKLIDKFFRKIDKQTSFKIMLNIINGKKEI